MNGDDVVLDALTAIRDAGIVVDRDQLNRGWAELLGRTVPVAPGHFSGIRCDHPHCHSPGIEYVEPAGTWCRRHVPQLWRPATGNPWACPRCTVCGQPAAYPANRFGVDPVCRDHAPRRMKPYLVASTARGRTGSVPPVPPGRTP